MTLKHEAGRNLQNTFGRNLKEIREFLGMSQATLAQRSGLTAAALSMIENGEREPMLTSVIRLLRALGVTFDRLIEVRETK